MTAGPPTGRRGRFWARRWHRWLGVVFAIPLLWLTVSGLVLRHADRLGLHESRVRSAWLLRQYGMIPEGLARSTMAGSRSVGEWDEILFLDGIVLEESGILVGAVAMGTNTVVATEDLVLVYDPDGALVDQLGEESLPAVPLEAVGRGVDGALVLRSGGKRWRIAEDFLSHEEAGPGLIPWSVVAALPEDAHASLENSLASQAGISSYRIWLDLHSGNLFGAVGRWAVDLSGLAIIALTLMGFRLVFRKGAGPAQSKRGPAADRSG
jgi:hypothetical protein